jgi:hypothetical protein
VCSGRVAQGGLHASARRMCGVWRTPALICHTAPQPSSLLPKCRAPESNEVQEEVAYEAIAVLSDEENVALATVDDAIPSSDLRRRRGRTPSPRWGQALAPSATCRRTRATFRSTKTQRPTSRSSRGVAQQCRELDLRLQQGRDA